MPIINLTKKEVERLKAEVQPTQIIQELKELEELWLNRMQILQVVFPEEYKKFKQTQES